MGDNDDDGYYDDEGEGDGGDIDDVGEDFDDKIIDINDDKKDEDIDDEESKGDDSETKLSDSSSEDEESSSEEKEEEKEKEDYVHPKITKYEIPLIIGHRAQEIAESNIIYENNNNYTNVIDIAIDDYNNGRINTLLLRPINNKKGIEGNLIDPKLLVRFPVSH